LQHIVPLQLLNAGEDGRIHEIDGQQELVVRLKEMGLAEGVTVRMVQSGEPCIIAYDNHRISFRGSDAAVIMVECIGNSCPSPAPGGSA